MQGKGSVWLAPNVALWQLSYAHSQIFDEESQIDLKFVDLDQKFLNIES